jgi:hypothetical protein
MQVAHTALLESLDIFSQAARIGCILLYRPSAFGGDAFTRAPDADVTELSKSKNDEEVRLMDGIEECEDSMDKGEVGESGELGSGD